MVTAACPRHTCSAYTGQARSSSSVHPQVVTCTTRRRRMGCSWHSDASITLREQGRARVVLHRRFHLSCKHLRMSQDAHAHLLGLVIASRRHASPPPRPRLQLRRNPAPHHSPRGPSPASSSGTYIGSAVSANRISTASAHVGVAATLHACSCRESNVVAATQPSSGKPSVAVAGKQSPSAHELMLSHRVEWQRCTSPPPTLGP